MVSDLVTQNGIKIAEDNTIFTDPNSHVGNKSKIWYFNDDSENKWVIKKYPEWVKEADIVWIHKYMRELSQKGFPLVEIKDKYLSFDNHIYSIYSFAGEMHYDFKNKSHLTNMASELSHLHRLSQDIKVEGSRNWPTVAGYIYQGKSEALNQSWNIASKLLKQSTSIIMPIHGDYRKDNIRFNANGVMKVFDFGNARSDYPEVDLAITLRDVIGDISKSQDYLEIQKGFLLEYRNSNRNLPKISPQMICASAIILAIQESSYLIKESLKSESYELKFTIKKETMHLDFLLDNLDTHLTLYQDIFH